MKQFKKEISKAILRQALKIFKPKSKNEELFLNIVAVIILIGFEIPIIIGVLAMGLIFDKFYLSIFAIVNTMFWRRNGGEHSPSSCFIASVAIFSMLFVACRFINNWVAEYALSIAMAFWYKKRIKKR